MSGVSPAVLDRARGALLGQLVGDALGTSVEFETAADVARRYPDGLREIVGGGPFRVKPGQVTDDGELALALARSLVQARGYDPDRAAAAYVAWYESGPFDIGGTTRQAFGGSVERGPGLARRLETRASASSEANGSLMRVSPLAIWGWMLPADSLANFAAQDSRLSHPHPRCQAACVVFTHAVAQAIRGGDPEAVHRRTAAFAAGRPELGWALAVLEAARAGPPDDYQQHQGWVAVALQNAFHRLLQAPSFEEGLVATVAEGGDADTNAAIAGALLGAVHGEAGIPERWRRAVLACRTDRGSAYQAADARELAERLAALGRRGGPPA